jgi:two-component system, sensor histidine kinase and response regulator
MGGVLSLTSAPGKGSTFFFTIPFDRAQDDHDAGQVGHVDASLRTQADSDDAPRSSSREPLTGRVLLVEDNVINQRVAAGFLDQFGLDVEIAADGLDGLEKAITGNYHLILMDCQMPRMDGFEATQRIRAHEDGRRRTPIIALTANALAGDRERCLDAGMDDYLTKPIDAGHLRHVLDTWLPMGDEIDDDVSVYDFAIVNQLRGMNGEDGRTLFDDVGALFLQRAPSRIEAISRLLAQEAWTEAAEEAHALKGMSAGVGANRLAAVAHEINEMCRMGVMTTAHVDELCGRLRVEHRVAVDRYPS